MIGIFGSFQDCRLRQHRRIQVPVGQHGSGGGQDGAGEFCGGHTAKC